MPRVRGWHSGAHHDAAGMHDVSRLGSLIVYPSERTKLETLLGPQIGADLSIPLLASGEWRINTS